MKRYILLTILLLTVNLVIGLAAVSSASPYYDMEDISIGAKMRHQLQQEGSTLTQIHMNGWAKINDNYMTLSGLEALARETLNTLEWNWLTEQTIDETEHTRQIKYSGEQDGGSLTVILQNSFQVVDGVKAYETYIAADVVANSIPETDEDLIYSNISELISLFKDKPCIRRTYIATIPGRLDTEKMDSICKQIILGLGGNITEESRDGGWISITGYSSEIGYALNSGSKQINLNAASRYNEFEDKTYIWLGTPIISVSY